MVGGAVGALLGVIVAVLALPTHRQTAWLGTTPLPWGLLLALGAALCCGLALRGAGWATVGFALGWSLLVLVVMPGGPGGDYVYASDVRGWGMLVGGVVVGAVLLVLGLSPGGRR